MERLGRGVKLLRQGRCVNEVVGMERVPLPKNKKSESEMRMAGSGEPPDKKKAPEFPPGPF
jgi:hypothetical protein